MASTNGNGTAIAVAAPLSPTTTPVSAMQSAESNAAAIHSKNTAALCRITTGDIPPPLIGASVTCNLSCLVLMTFSNAFDSGRRQSIRHGRKEATESNIQ